MHKYLIKFHKKFKIEMMINKRIKIIKRMMNNKKK
jgi:hypothetical protein